ncbi:MAG: leucyl/phenylalanyl-tRNA--protein transferase [Cyanobacteria bacterium J06639_1]
MWNIDTIVNGYAQGYFLMHDEESGRVQWFSTPRERAVIPLDDRFRYPRSLHRVLKRQQFHCRINTEFAAVVRGCAARPETWISAELADIYLALHAAGWAHSFEIWQGEHLAGGLLGIVLGGAFIGESMFHAVPNASKVGLVKLVDRLRDRGFSLLDAQVANPHLDRFGAIAIPQAEYLHQLRMAVQQNCRWLESPPRTRESSIGELI